MVLALLSAVTLLLTRASLLVCRRAPSQPWLIALAATLLSFPGISFWSLGLAAYVVPVAEPTASYMAFVFAHVVLFIASVPCVLVSFALRPAWGAIVVVIAADGPFAIGCLIAVGGEVVAG